LLKIQLHLRKQMRCKFPTVPQLVVLIKSSVKK
jgi:hypothetical protein